MGGWITQACVGWLVLISARVSAEPRASLVLQQAQPKPEGKGSLIQFDKGVVDIGATIPSQSDLKKLVSATTTNLFIYVEPKGDVDKYQTRITYTFFLTDGKKPVPLSVTAHPYGAFVPQRLQVNFSASLDGGEEETGTIEFPVFALNSSDYLMYSPCKDEHLTVALSGETDICLALQSPLAAQDLQILGQVDVSPRHTEYYNGVITANADPSKIVLHVRPKFWAALGASVADVGGRRGDSNQAADMDSGDDRFSGTIHYQATFSTINMNLPLSVPIRFYPGLPRLFLFAVAGVLVGAFLRSAANDTPLLTPKRWRPLVALVVLTVVIEAAGIVLFDQTQTIVKVAGVDMDPSRLLPAFLVGVIVGVSGLKKSMALFGSALQN